MRLYVAGLTIALIAAGFWTVVGPDSLVNAQTGCITQGAVSAGETGLAADCEVLLDVRDTLAGTASLNWAADVRIEKWDGITTGGAPTRVIGVSLANGGLSGTVPPEMGSLSHLIGLFLYDNQLTGTIPPEMGNLSNLLLLDLHGNQLAGELPNTFIGLISLRQLSFHNNNGLCAPVNDAFQTWLKRIVIFDGSSCAPQDSQEDRTALARLYRSTDGANWQNNSNWLSGRPLRTWHGVTTDANGGVSGLYLGYNRLSGSIPSELGSLANLTRLFLHDNQLAGTIPAQLGSLSNLWNLSLGSNQLSGPIPPELGSLSNLWNLSLGSNQLSGPIPPELGSLSNLDRMYLNDNQLTGPLPSSFTSLTRLGIFFFSDNAGLCAPTDDAFRAWLQGVGGVQGYSCDFASDRAVLVSLYNTTGGANWDDSSNWLSDRPMGSWHGVTTDDQGRVSELNFINNGLTGRIPPQLGNLSNLKLLRLWGGQLTETIPRELGHLSKLEEIDLGVNQLTGTIPAQIGNLHNLRRLSLWDNQLSGPIPPELGNLHNLRELHLSNNPFTGSIPSELGNLSNLEELRLDRNQLTGSIPSELGSLSNLEELNLWGNQLSGAIPSELGNLHNLIRLYLGDNQLSGPIPPELGNLSNLRRLYLRDNQLTGCIPEMLLSVRYNDLDELELPICGIPTVTVSADSAHYRVRINSPITVTAAFSEPIYDFTVDDVSVANGHVSYFSGSDDDSVFVFDVSPNAIGEVTVQVADGVATDYEGYGNTAATQLSLGLPYDDDRDGTIGLAEAIAAVSDYFDGNLRLDHAIAVVSLYFASL